MGSNIKRSSLQPELGWLLSLLGCLDYSGMPQGHADSCTWKGREDTIFVTDYYGNWYHEAVTLSAIHSAQAFP